MLCLSPALAVCRLLSRPSTVRHHHFLSVALSLCIPTSLLLLWRRVDRFFSRPTNKSRYPTETRHVMRRETYHESEAVQSIEWKMGGTQQGVSPNRPTFSTTEPPARIRGNGIMRCFRATKMRGNYRTHNNCNALQTTTKVNTTRVVFSSVCAGHNISPF